VYAGPMRGDAVLLLFDTASLPPPDGNGTTPTAIARIPKETLFGAQLGTTAAGPFSAAFTFTQVPSGRSYQIRAFLDVSGEFNPFFDFTQQPRAGAPAGGHGELDSSGQPRLLAINVPAGTAVSGISVALTETVPYDPPSFEIAGGSPTLDVSIDRPVEMRLK